MLKVRSHSLAVVHDHAAAAADAGIVEQQMDLVGVLLAGNLACEAIHLLFVRDVGHVRGDPKALRQALDLAQPLGLGHRRRRDVAHGDVAALGDQLAGEFAAHARAAAGDDGNPPCDILHVLVLPRSLLLLS